MNKPNQIHSQSEINSVRVNLDHLIKHLDEIRIVTKNGEYETYTGQSECEQFIRESLGIYPQKRKLYPNHESE